MEVRNQAKSAQLLLPLLVQQHVLCIDIHVLAALQEPETVELALLWRLPEELYQLEAECLLDVLVLV